MTINVTRTIAEVCDTVMADMQEEALEKHPQDLPFPNGIVKEQGNDVVYTEEAQLVFNSLFKKFLPLFKDNKL